MWRYKTKVGMFTIVEKRGRFHPMYDGDSLGSYKTPEQAAEDLAGGCTFWPPSGINPGILGIPYDLSEWERVKRS